MIQLTHLSNYTSYGEFRGFPRTFPSAAFPALGWNPDTLIAADNRGAHHADNCVDSACFYVVRRENMLSHMDVGISQSDVIRVSNDVNGYVAIQNLNGLDARLQSAIHLKYFSWKTSRAPAMKASVFPGGEAVKRSPSWMRRDVRW